MTRKNPSFTSRDEWMIHLREKGYELEEGHWPHPDKGLNAYTLFQSHSSSRRKIAVLAHGTGNDHIFTFQRLIEALLQKGICVLSFDLPGHGVKSCTHLDSELFLSGAKSLELFLKERGNSNWERIGIGYSLGALFLLSANAESQNLFQTLILLALPRKIQLRTRFFLQESLSFLSPAFLRQWKTYGWREAWPAAGSFRRDDFPIRLRSQNSSYPQFISQLFELHSPESYVKNLSQKCVLISGARDYLAPPSDSEHWRKVNPNLSLIKVDRANHFLLPFLQTTIDIIIREIS